ncbi:MAG: HAMP domain-containing histidine kinase [Lachnospiraceae bacterium]|nr:HAMP domain-containing histidine kinase [Lachnospiraceae bacterium]
MTKVLISVSLAATVVGIAFGIWQSIRARKVVERVEKMLSEAMTGDFTERDYSEDRLSRLETKLYDYLNSSAVSAVSVKNERDKIKTLISDISHQTKTPIANLLLHGELLEESGLNPEQQGSMEAILRETGKLRFLIDALVKLSRLENGILSLNPAMESVDSLMKSVHGEMLAKAEGKGLRLEIAESGAEAFFDMKWTAEALANIVDNAIKYTEKGSVSLSAEEYEMFVCVKVRDTGVGIEEEDIPKIFSRFSRLEAAHQQEGVGIGLYLAREIVTGEGGYIKVASEPGKGSEFSVFLRKDANISKLT